MITVGELKRLLSVLPDHAFIGAYEGEGCGLRVLTNEQFGWIETGCTDDYTEPKYDLTDFVAAEFDVAEHLGGLV